MRLFLLLFALTFSLPAPAQQPAPRKVKVKKTAVKKETAPVLMFERTPCHGTCPVYKATVFADGRVEYEGDRYVPQIGKRTLQMPVAQLNELLAEARRLGFAKFKASYPSQVYDLPSTVVMVRQPGQPAHTVEVRGEAPPELTAYLEKLRVRMDAVVGLAPTE